MPENKDQNVFRDAVEDYIDTSDRPYDNKTGGVEAISDYKAIQLGGLKLVSDVGVGPVGLVTDTAVGVTRISLAYNQNDIDGATYEAGRVLAEGAGTIVGGAIGFLTTNPFIVLGSSAAGSYAFGHAYDYLYEHDIVEPYWTKTYTNEYGHYVITTKSGKTYHGTDYRAGNLDFDRCFPAHTLISTSQGQRQISELRVGDRVWAFDARAGKGRGGLVLKRIKRLYRNTTTEWVKLNWVEGGEQKALIATPGHHFLDELGQFPTIEEMIKQGKANIVLASGELAEVTTERIVYSAETAHLFEQAQSVGRFAGNAALAPSFEDAWQTYNFEVEDFHTYIAEGVRVHNDSGVLGQVGNSIDGGLDRLLGGRDGDGSFRDKVTDLIGGPFHAAGKLVNGALKAVASVASGFGGAVANLARGNIVGAVGSFVGGVAGAVGSVVSGVADAVGSFVGGVGSFVGGVADAVGSFVGGVADAVGSFVGGVFDAIGSIFDDDSSSSSSSGGGGDSSGKPVIVDMDGDGIELTRLDESTTDFDFDDDGFLERTAWTSSDDALLVFDLNEDGKVTESKEIAFAKWTEEDDTDLEALAAHFDTNQDKVLDERDAGWSQFRLWQDRNSDGVVDEGEMITLDEAGIKSIGLETREGTGQVLSDGTVIHGLVDVQKEDGSITDGADVAFAYNSFGFRSYKDEEGNLVYEFEDGEIQKIKKLGESIVPSEGSVPSEGETDFNLGDETTVWIGADTVRVPYPIAA